MSIGCCFWTVLLSGFLLTVGICGLPASTNIDCNTPMPYTYPSIDEGFTGRLELVKTPPEAHLTLESPSCPVCLSFLDLSHTPGDSLATVQTKKPLDAEILTEYNGTFTYSVVCMKSGVRNDRTLGLKDINDNTPVFEKDVYEVQVSKFLPVRSLVVQVKATDADVSPLYNTVTYSIKPPSDTFEVTSDGSVLLNKQLNCTITTLYSFNVTAMDIDGNSNSTTVMVTVTDGPTFEYKIYNASVSKKEVGPIENIDPAPIKAKGGNKHSIIYHISAVDPSEYLSNFVINNKSGIITIQTQLSHVRASTVSLDIQASLENDNTKTANAMVILDVENGPEVGNNPPVFSQQVYSAEIFSVVPVDFTVLVVKATDPDVGETEMLKYSLVDPNSLFAVEPSSGLVHVVSDLHSGTETLKVRATDPHGLYDTTTVEVMIKESGEDNIATMSLNKPYDTVVTNANSIEDALENATMWEVHIISITKHDDSVKQDRALKKDSTFQTNVHFIAMVQSGSVIMCKYDIKGKLESEKESVLEKLRAVLGADVDFEIPEGPPGIDLVAIVLGTLAVMAVVSGALVGVMLIKRKQQKRRGSQDSMEGMPPFYIWDPVTQRNIQPQMELHRVPR
ncbi:hypothetical protein ACEWY4_017548 [Coilia grayii]|uniref:Cadherin domain-containing protein n=1 Tax=Coilia grayii TaxID=363190 RepID=A0ABD1JHE8_9TELE